MEVSALKYSGTGGLHGRSPLLRLQSDERLIALIRRGNGTAFELLVTRYEARLLAFCRHMLSSREDAEDVLQEVLAASYNAIIADSRPINVRPWLYRIARNRCLNHLRRVQAIGVDSMDIHYSDHGASTADKVHDRAEFRMLVDDIQDLPETQRTALVLREMEALSYEQIAEAMETTVSSIKSLLVRARTSLAEASEARLLSCEEVRLELAEVAEGLRKKLNPAVRRHIKNCEHCGGFETQIKRTGRALAAVMPFGPLALLRKTLLAPLLGHSAGSGAAGAGTASATSAATGAAAGGLGAGASGAGAIGTVGSAVTAGGSGSLLTAGVSAIATKAAAGLAAAAIVTAGAVEAGGSSHPAAHPAPAPAVAVAHAATAGAAQASPAGSAVAAPIAATAATQPGAQSANVVVTTTTDATTTTTPTSTTATTATTTLPTATPQPPAPAATTEEATGAAGTSGGTGVTGTSTGTSTTQTGTGTTSTGTSTTPTGTTTSPTSTTTSTTPAGGGTTTPTGAATPGGAASGSTP